MDRPTLDGGVMRRHLTLSLLISVAVLAAVSPASAQRDFQRGFPRDPRRGSPRSAQRGRPPRLLERFDADKNGRLDDEERAKARESVRESRGQRYGSGRPLRRTTRPDPIVAVPAPVPEGEGLEPPSNVELYDDRSMRVLHFRFTNADWFEELGDFYGSDVDVSADLSVDGVDYRGVGVRFRGRSSYITIGDSEKRSFNVDVDFTVEGQTLYGYKSLNLLNCHADPGFLREVLYSRICSEYLPTLKSGFVHVLVNGEDWGVYANVQQFNGDSLREWYGTGRGVRWKVPGRARGAAFEWHGPDVEEYERAYVLKKANADAPWKTLMLVCELLDTAPPERLEETLGRVLDIDGALWCLALENVFMDNDGYVAKASDYAIYQDGREGRIHLLQYDGSEVFGISGPEWDGEPTIDPLLHEGSQRRPLIHRLFAVPELRARYLAHVRTLIDERLDWKIFGVEVEAYHEMLAVPVCLDPRKIFTEGEFARSIDEDIRYGRIHITGLRRFVEDRREFLLAHPEIAKPAPTIRRVADVEVAEAGQPVRVTAEIAGEVAADEVLLYFATRTAAPFETLEMRDDGEHGDGAARDGVFGVEIPGLPAGTRVRYYVEARAVRSAGATIFEPRGAEFRALDYRVRAQHAKSSVVRINEVSSANESGVTDPQGEHEDWIELVNLSDREIDLSGMYLSDDHDDPRKWELPAGAKIAPHGYLVVWADEDDGDADGLHASFKLSRDGEAVLLVDANDRGNLILDATRVPPQSVDQVHGRWPDGAGELQPMQGTPGRENVRN